MTLITYVTRVHFADGVLEEALWSEVEVNRKTRPLIVTDEAHLKSELYERLLAGLPVRTSIEVVSDVPDIPNESAARHIAEIYERTDRDLLISFGRNTAIDLAKISRISIAHQEPLETFSYATGGSRRIGNNLPDLYAVPGIQGFGSAVSAHAPVVLQDGERTRLMCKKLVPTVTICDPTLTLGATPVESGQCRSRRAWALRRGLFVTRIQSPRRRDRARRARACDRQPAQGAGTRQRHGRAAN